MRKTKKKELSFQEKREYEVKNLIDWENGKCEICTFPLHVNPSDEIDREKFSYSDFIIQKEHKFLRNIFSKEHLEKSDAIKSIESYHKHFLKYLKICVYAEKCINSLKNFSECYFDELTEFIDCELPELNDFSELKEKILETEVKSSQKSQISKFNLCLYAFFYQKIMSFPMTNFECETVTTNNYFENFHKILNVKIHLHHSHVTGEIIGYTHDFCNWIVRENKDMVACMAHNFFKFDFYFILKHMRLSAWRTKDVNIGGKNLTDINFASIDNFKFIDTIKYYQTSLAQLSETITEVEREKIKTLTVQFLSIHSYFSIVWRELNLDQKIK